MSILSSLASIASLPPLRRKAQACRLGVTVAVIGAAAWLLAGGIAAPQSTLLPPSSPLTLAPASHAPAADTVPPALDGFGQAGRQLALGHYAEAHRRFALLADCGHRESARIALEMRRQGAPAYGMNFPVGPKRLARWQALLASQAPVTTQMGAPAGSDCLPAGAAGDEQAHWRHQGVG